MVNLVGFGTIASGACGEQVAGVCAAAHACWDDVVDGVGLGPAVCAGVCVAFEYVESECFPVGGF